MQLISKSDFGEFFNKDNLNDLKCVDNLFNVAKNIKLKSYKNKETVFYAGDQGDKIYLILYGSVNILRNYDQFCYLTGEEYIAFLKDLKDKGDIYRVEKIINLNYSKYDFSIDQIDEITECIFRKKVFNSLQNYDVELMKEIFRDHNKKFSHYLIDLKKLEDLEKRRKPIPEWPRFINQIMELEAFSNCDTEQIKKTELSKGIIKDSFLREKEKFKLILNKEFFCLKRGKYFGEYAIESNGIRTATIETSNDTENIHLGEITKENYYDYIFKEKNEMINKRINFVYDNFIQGAVRKSIFIKKFFKNFVFEEFNKNQLLISDSNVDYIYIIEKGKVEVTANFDFEKLIEEIKMYLLINEEVKKKFEENEKINFLIDKLEQNTFGKDLIKKKEMLLKIYSDKEILGMEYVFFGVPFNFTAKVKSEKLNVMKIEGQLFKRLYYGKNMNEIFLDLAKKRIYQTISRLNIWAGNIIHNCRSKIEYEKILEESKNKIVLNTNEIRKIPFSPFKTPHTEKKLKPISRKIEEVEDNKPFNLKMTDFYLKRPYSPIQETSKLMRNRNISLSILYQKEMFKKNLFNNEINYNDGSFTKKETIKAKGNLISKKNSKINSKANIIEIKDNAFLTNTNQFNSCNKKEIPVSVNPNKILSDYTITSLSSDHNDYDEKNIDSNSNSSFSNKDNTYNYNNDKSISENKLEINILKCVTNKKLNKKNKENEIYHNFESSIKNTISYEKLQNSSIKDLQDHSLNKKLNNIDYSSQQYNTEGDFITDKSYKLTEDPVKILKNNSGFPLITTPEKITSKGDIVYKSPETLMQIRLKNQFLNTQRNPLTNFKLDFKKSDDSSFPCAVTNFNFNTMKNNKKTDIDFRSTVRKSNNRFLNTNNFNNFKSTYKSTTKSTNADSRNFGLNFLTTSNDKFNLETLINFSPQMRNKKRKFWTSIDKAIDTREHRNELLKTLTNFPSSPSRIMKNENKGIFRKFIIKDLKKRKPL